MYIQQSLFFNIEFNEQFLDFNVFIVIVGNCEVQDGQYPTQLVEVSLMFHVGQVLFERLEAFFGQFELLVPAFEQEVSPVRAFEPGVGEALFGTWSVFLNWFEESHDEIFALGGQI